MSSFFSKLDFPLFLSIIFLLSLGLATIYSLSLGSNDTTQIQFFYRQAIFAVLGLVIFAIIIQIGFSFFDNIAPFLFVLINILLLVTFILGVESRGSIRWIDLGFFRFQPTEFAKPILVLFLLHFFERHNIKSIVNVLLGLAACLPTIIFTFLQPDLGSTIILVMLVAAVYFLMGIPARFIALAASVFLVLSPLIWFFLHDYQRQRLFSFLSPTSDPTGAGYNSIQALIAIGSGRLFGLGFGRGTQSHLNFLPEKHTDFIFASLSEELGFLGSVILISSFVFLIYRVVTLANQTSNSRARIFGLVVATLVGVQMFVNIGMNLSLMPITGITLPLISYGGSSLISIMMSLGLVQSARNSFRY